MEKRGTLIIIHVSLNQHNQRKLKFRHLEGAAGSVVSALDSQSGGPGLKACPGCLLSVWVFNPVMFCYLFLIICVECL